MGTAARIAGVVLVAVGLAACGGAATSTHTASTPRSHPTLPWAAAGRPATRVHATGPQADSLLAQIIAGLGPHSAITAATVGTSPANTGVSGPWLYLTADEPGAESGDMLAEWQSLLVLGAYRDRGVAESIPDTLGVDLTAASPTGSAYDSNGSTGVDQSGAPDAIPAADTAALTTRITQAMAGDHLTPVSISYETPDQAAPVVIAQTDEPAAAVAGVHTFLANALGDPNGHEGDFVEIDDSATGAPVWIGWYATRLATGDQWTAPAYFTNPGL